MFGFVLAAGCALGLVFLSRGRRRHGGMRHMLRYTFAKLGTTPGQEQVLRSALLRVREQAETLADDLHAARPQLSEVLVAEEFDEGRVEQWLSDREQAFSQSKPRLIESLREMHGVLDADQRRKLGHWVEGGSRRLFPFGGHHGRWGHVC